MVELTDRERRTISAFMALGHKVQRVVKRTPRISDLLVTLKTGEKLIARCIDTQDLDNSNMDEFASVIDREKPHQAVAMTAGSVNLSPLPNSVAGVPLTILSGDLLDEFLAKGAQFQSGDPLSDTSPHRRVQQSEPVAAVSALLASSQQAITVGKAMRTCPYCAEVIQEKAIVCRYCGHNLSGGPPEVVAKQRLELTNKLAELQRSLAAWERYLADYAHIEQQAGRQFTWSIVALLVGLFLIPAWGLGLILVIAAILAAMTQADRRKNAERAMGVARQNIQLARGFIAEISGKLSALA